MRTAEGLYFAGDGHERDGSLTRGFSNRSPPKANLRDGQSMYPRSQPVLVT